MRRDDAERCSTRSKGIGDAFSAAGEDLLVDAFDGQGAIESFDLAVLARAVQLSGLWRAQRCDDLGQ
jgi:hypothetical protein